MSNNKWGQEQFAGAGATAPQQPISQNEVQVMNGLDSLSHTVSQMVATNGSEDCKEARDLIDATRTIVASVYESTQQKVLSTGPGLGKGATTGTSGT